MAKEYVVYMIANRHHTVLYIGMTGQIDVRGWQHKRRLVDGFTKKYNITKMVYFESYENVHEAIEREKQLKGWTRKKKDKVNPEWKDVYEEAIR